MGPHDPQRDALAGSERTEGEGRETVGRAGGYIACILDIVVFRLACLSVAGPSCSLLLIENYLSYTSLLFLVVYLSLSFLLFMISIPPHVHFVFLNDVLPYFRSLHFIFCLLHHILFTIHRRLFFHIFLCCLVLPMSTGSIFQEYFAMYVQCVACQDSQNSFLPGAWFGSWPALGS